MNLSIPAPASTRLVAAALAVPLALAAFASAGAPAQAPREGSETEKSAAPSIDETYVRSQLKDYLNPDKLEFLPDGRVKLEFDFYERKTERETIFTPKIGRDPNSPFRWHLPYEWWYGLRFGDKGYALLNAWFADDLEMTGTYWQGTSSRQSQIFAMVYQTDKGHALGSNYGQQAIVFSRGRPGSRKGSKEPVIMDQRQEMGLKVAKGRFQAVANKRVSGEMEYPPKSFESGRPGFIWAGGVAVLLRNLTITGRLDYERMAKEMRRAKRRR